jgi:hypothetical protein
MSKESIVRKFCYKWEEIVLVKKKKNCEQETVPGNRATPQLKIKKKKKEQTLRNNNFSTKILFSIPLTKNGVTKSAPMCPNGSVSMTSLCLD